MRGVPRPPFLGGSAGRARGVGGFIVRRLWARSTLRPMNGHDDIDPRGIGL
jgi:hypothetical protein